MKMMELLSMPNAKGKHGMHISAQLRVEAMQLEAHGIAWAARTMEQAANRIDELETMIMKQEGDSQI